MQIVDPGHCYLLNVIDGREGETQELRFVMRNNPPEKYPGNLYNYSGVQLQEVNRACIDRVLYLSKQAWHPNNPIVVEHYRTILSLLEERAAERHGRIFTRPRIDIENEPVCPKCGHIQHICEEAQVGTAQTA